MTFVCFESLLSVWIPGKPHKENAMGILEQLRKRQGAQLLSGAWTLGLGELGGTAGWGVLIRIRRKEFDQLTLPTFVCNVA